MAKSQLNPRYTFDNFIVGSSNRHAHRAAMQLCEKPGNRHNPLFIFGDTGLGKTHLMQAIGIRLRAKQPRLKILYVTSEKFTNELIQEVSKGGSASFHKRHNNIDVLLIDDIHFVSGKERTQEEFFRIFNGLYKAGKQIVLSSDQPSGKIPNIQKKLIARFSWGLTVELKPPAMKLRLTILEEKSRLQGFHLPQRLARLIALRIRSNIRKLEGALNKVIAYQRLAGEEVTMDILDGFLKDQVSDEEEKAISMDKIQRLVAGRFGIKLSSLLGGGRTRTVTRPRQIAMYLSRNLIGCSLSEIGEAFGGRDHATVLYACRIMENGKKKDRKLARELNELERAIKG